MTDAWAGVRDIPPWVMYLALMYAATALIRAISYIMGMIYICIKEFRKVRQ